jgi:hypothetical protein
MCGRYEPEYNTDEEEFVAHFALIYKNLFYTSLIQNNFTLFLIHKNLLYFF